MTSCYLETLGGVGPPLPGAPGKLAVNAFSAHSFLRGAHVGVVLLAVMVFLLGGCSTDDSRGVMPFALRAPHARMMPSVPVIHSLEPLEGPLRLAYAPVASELDDDAWAPLTRHLHSRLGVEIVPVSYQRYADILLAVERQEVDLALLAPLSYVLAKERVSGLEPLARVLSDGKTSYSSYLFVKRGSRYRELKELKGARVAFVDELSTSGFLMPYALLLDQDIDPEVDLGAVLFEGSHVGALRALAEERADVAASYADAVPWAQSRASREDWEMPAVSLLGNAGRVPLDLLCAAPSVPEGVREALRDELLATNTASDAGMSFFLSSQRIVGWSPASDDSYEEVRRGPRARAGASGRERGRDEEGGSVSLAAQLLRPFLGLRGRMALNISLFAVAAGVCLGVLLATMTVRLAYLSEREQGAAILRALAPSTARAIARQDLAAADDLFSEAVQQVHPRFARILFIEAYDGNGKSLLRSSANQPLEREVLLGMGPDFRQRVALSDEICWLQLEPEPGRDVVVISMPAVSGLRWGTLVAAYDLEPLQRRSRTWFRNTLLFVLVLGAGLVPLVWWITSSQVMRPLDRLLLAAQRMQRGDLSARVALERADEMGEVARAFDDMATSLQAHTADLERKVAERSARVHQQKEELVRVNRELAESNLRLERLATTDPLTGLANRRQLEQSLDFELARSHRNRHPFCVLVMDLDRFKLVNDTWGHPCGDEVLRGLAGILRANLRATDLRARWGGEEFVVMLLDTELEAGQRTADKIRALVQDHPFERPDGERLEVTISIGLACFPEHATDGANLLSLADQALYRAKTSGRNRVEVATDLA